MKIKVFDGIEPCLLEVDGMGVHRDRTPDAGWGGLRYTILSKAKNVELTPQLKIILIEDLAFYKGSDSEIFSELMRTFELYQ